ncbi:MAG TPA: transposase [Balneolaceae bacterium]|nr:transposase [Balneolaceae bacterium]
MKITIIWRYLVGIDVSKNLLDIYLLDRKTGMGHECQVSNNPKGFARLARWLAEHEAEKSQTKLISEHTGRYGEHLLRWTTDNDWTHAVVKTTALKNLRGEHPRKTDAFDATDLAEYGERFSDRLWLAEAPKPAVGQIKRLQAERRAMVDRRAALKAKLTEADIHDAHMEPIIRMWDEQVAQLTEHIEELEERITQQISPDPVLSRRYQTMRSAPGMGKVLTPLWVSLFAGQQSLDGRQIAARFGHAPKPYRSGTSVRKPDRSAGFGNSEVRKVLHQAALSVKRNYPHYQEYYNRKKAEGKDHLLIINNIINKLIRLYCAMWNNRSEYDPNHIPKMEKKYGKSAEKA